MDKNPDITMDIHSDSPVFREDKKKKQKEMKVGKEKAKKEKGMKSKSLAGRISAILCVAMLLVFVLMNILLLVATGRSFETNNEDYLKSTTSLNVEREKKSITLAENTATAIEDH